MRMTNEKLNGLIGAVDDLKMRVGVFQGNSVSTGLIGKVNALFDHVRRLEKRIDGQAGLLEQLAALHGKEITDFKPTTSKYGVILVDATEDIV